MKDQILVPLKRRDQIEEVMPYIEKIAKPGMNVVFLIRSSFTNWPRMEAHLAAMHTGNAAPLQDCEAILRFEYERQKRLAEESVQRFDQRLGRKGVQTHVKIYGGRRKRILRNSTRNGNVRLVVMPAAGPSPWVRLLQAVGSAFGPIRQAPHCSVLLLHPGQTFER
jgi:nucleotide-binding universal stress UspA family protein